MRTGHLAYKLCVGKGVFKGEYNYFISQALWEELVKKLCFYFYGKKETISFNFLQILFFMKNSKWANYFCSILNWNFHWILAFEHQKKLKFQLEKDKHFHFV